MNNYSIAFAASVDEIPEALWAECFPAELEGRWWYEALEKSGLEDQFEFAYAVIREQDRPIGIAPLFVMDVPLQLVVPPIWMPLFRLLSRLFGRRFRFQRTLFVGSPCSDEGTVGLLPNVDRIQALTSLQTALRSRARQLDAAMLVWKDFPGRRDDELGALATATGMFRLESFPGTIVDLPGPSRDDYYAALRARHRNKLKKKLKLGAAALPVKVEVLRSPSTAELDQIFALFWQTYEKATTRFERLNRRFFDLAASCPHSRFVVLREPGGGRIVSFMLCFLLGGRAINKFIGIDYGLPPGSFLYFRLWDAAVDWLAGEGIRSVQSGQTGYSAKLELEHRLDPLTNWCLHCNPLVHVVYRQVARSVSWATLDPDLAQHLTAHPVQGHASSAIAAKPVR